MFRRIRDLKLVTEEPITWFCKRHAQTMLVRMWHIGSKKSNAYCPICRFEAYKDTIKWW